LVKSGPKKKFARWSKKTIKRDDFENTKEEVFRILGISEIDLHSKCTRSTSVRHPNCPSDEWLQLTKSNVFGYICPQDLFPSGIKSNSGGADCKQTFGFGW